MENSEKVTNSKKRLTPQNIISLLLALALLATTYAIVNLLADDAVATVNGEKISKEELFTAMYALAGAEALEDIITVRLIYQEGKKSGYSISEAEIDEEIELIIQDYFEGSEEKLYAYLELYGISLLALREDIHVNLLVKKLAEGLVFISEEEAQEYFAENQESFNIQEAINARHILVETEEEARTIIARLDQGEDFADLATEYSLDGSSSGVGGELGYFSMGGMDTEFEAAAFSLQVGERSQAVETMYGYHIIELLDRQEGSEVTYDEVEEQVREQIRENQISYLIDEIIAELWDNADVVYKLW